VELKSVVLRLYGSAFLPHKMVKSHYNYLIVSEYIMLPTKIGLGVTLIKNSTKVIRINYVSLTLKSL